MSEGNRSHEWMTIPVIPCTSIEETLSFWESLGFRITYKQTRPYQYGVIERGGYDLHFAKVKGMDASNNYSGCLIMVNDAEKVYQEFTLKFKAALGKVPHTGLPRISRMKPGTTRFTVTDVSGNSVIFISYGEKDQEDWEKADDKTQSPLSKAIATANRFRNYKEDYKAAAATLDVALRKASDENYLVMAEALAIRLELASLMDDPAVAEDCRKLIQQMNLNKDEAEKMRVKHNVQF